MDTELVIVSAKKNNDDPRAPHLSATALAATVQRRGSSLFVRRYFGEQPMQMLPPSWSNSFVFRECRVAALVVEVAAWLGGFVCPVIVVRAA